MVGPDKKDSPKDDWGSPADPRDYEVTDFLEDEEEEDVKKAIRFSMPPPWGVVYARPNPDASRKNCKNCMMYSLDNKCSIMDEGKDIRGNMICGYHVYGTPAKLRMDHPGMQAVDSKNAGLETVEGGTSCDNCVAYRPHDADDSKGECLAVYIKGKPATVEGRGCCARWDSK